MGTFLADSNGKLQILTEQLGVFVLCWDDGPDRNDPAVVSRCLEIGLPVLPGCMTPTDVALAVSLGLEAVKIFPAEAAGGV